MRQSPTTGKRQGEAVAASRRPRGGAERDDSPAPAAPRLRPQAGARAVFPHSGAPAGRKAPPGSNLEAGRGRRMRERSPSSPAPTSHPSCSPSSALSASQGPAVWVRNPRLCVGNITGTHRARQHPAAGSSPGPQGGWIPPSWDLGEKY